MKIEPLGPVRAGGGALFVFVGPANTAIQWTIAQGGGSLTPLSGWTDAGGIACALYNAAGTQPGETLIVRASTHGA